MWYFPWEGYTQTLYSKWTPSTHTHTAHYTVTSHQPHVYTVTSLHETTADWLPAVYTMTAHTKSPYKWHHTLYTYLHGSTVAPHYPSLHTHSDRCRGGGALESCDLHEHIQAHSICCHLMENSTPQICGLYTTTECSQMRKKQSLYYNQLCEEEHAVVHTLHRPTLNWRRRQG